MNLLLLYHSLCLFTMCQMPRLVKSWPEHDISTLKHLQIVHRHGDRNLNGLKPNDPFNNMSQYWPEGVGELTAKGKYQMYRLGQYLRREYNHYLGDQFSPREVYVRSSAKKRCLESVSCLLAGAYPPNSTQWQWDSQLGKMWQPFPIETFIPMDDDKLLRTEAYCPKATEAMDAIEASEYVQKRLKAEHNFLRNLSQLIGTQIKTTLDCKNMFDFLDIEYKRGLKWSDFGLWSPEYETKIFEKLLPLSELLWQTEWNSSLVQRTRAGPLIEELLENMKTVIDSGRSERKVHIYSTHDSMIGVLLHSLQVFNGRIIPIAASIIFELHQKSNSDPYFVRIYYLNETEPEFASYLLELPECNNSGDCPINTFTTVGQTKISNDWNFECGITTRTSDVFTSINMFLLIINIALVVIFMIVLIVIWCRRRRSSYQSLD